MANFEEFYKLLKYDRQKSSWSRSNTIKFRTGELKKEVDEILEAIEKDDTDNLKEELGDTLWDLLAIFVIAEEKGLFNHEEIISEAIDKLHRRKPYIKTGEKLSIEEEIKIWKKIKTEEKIHKS